MFLGNLIKAAVSRQREYLADASAVQFTRNPSGIAGALKRIGASSSGSRLETPRASEASHMFFAQGVWEGISGMWMTHPPLDKRILAIEPTWDGKFPAEGSVRSAVTSELAAGFAAGTYRSGSQGLIPVQVVDEAVEHVGDPTTEHQNYAAELVSDLPKVLVDATHEPFAAHAVVYALLLNREPQVRNGQFEILQQYAQPAVVNLTTQLLPLLDKLDPRARLPLLEMTLPALKSMCASQYQSFHRSFVALAKADERIDLFEWMLAQVLQRHLAPQFENTQSPHTLFYGLAKLSREISVLISTVAAAGNDEAMTHAAFRAGASHLPDVELTLVPKEARNLDTLRDVLKQLIHASAKQRGRIVDACAAAICADNHVKWQEAELLRGISDLLDCPMPPLLVKLPAHA